MTIQEYLDPRLFPLTSQQGLQPLEQVQLDAVNFDEYSVAMRNREQLNEHERAVGRELEAKHAARGSVLSQLQQQ